MSRSPLNFDVARGLLVLMLTLLTPTARADSNDMRDNERRHERNSAVEINAATAGRAAQAQPVAASTTTAPPYAVSGRWAELQSKVLAQTPRSPVTALDALMFDAMNQRGAQGLPYEVWLDPGQPGNEAQTALIRSVIQQFAVAQDQAAKAGGYTPAEDEIRALNFGPAIAAFNQIYVQPKVKVEQADIDHYYLSHPDRYFNRRRVQVRFIFIPAKTPEEVSAATDQLNVLIREITTSKGDFAAAARKLSKAPSAAEGGLIPPFTNGTHFQSFEDMAFSLATPGEVSSVFQGPDGVYLEQLVERWPISNIPIENVRAEIERTLAADHIKFYYQYELEKLQRKYYVLVNWPLWDYLNLDAPVAQVGPTALRRSDYYRFYPEPNDPAYNVQWPVLASSIGFWTEGETISQYLARQNQLNHPFIQRGRELALLTLRARHASRAAVPLERTIPQSTAIATLKADEKYLKTLRSLRAITIEVQMEPQPGRTPEQVKEIGKTLTALNAQLDQGVIPALPADLTIARWWETHSKNAMTSEGTLAAVAQIRESLGSRKYKDVDVKVVDQGWVPSVPGSSIFGSLVGLKPGQMSPGIRFGEITIHYVILGEGPLALEPLEAKPLLLQNLAFASIISRNIEAVRTRLEPEIRYTF